MSERVKQLLAKAAVKSPGIEPIIPGGRAPLINGLDVMAAMAGCQKVGSYLCLAKYSRDANARVIAIQLLAHHILARGESNRIEQEDAEKISEIVIDLEVDPGLDRCPKCQGRRAVMVRGVNQDCKRCDGLGRVTFSEKRTAELCEIDRHQFRNRKYLDLFKHFQAMVGEWETSTLFIMDAKLFGEERVAV
jgi:hypothetical protein